MTKQAIAKELRTSLEAVGIPQSRAALRLGISLPYLNRILAGRGEPSDALVSKMCEFTKALKRSGLTETG